MGGRIIDLLCRCFSRTQQPALFRQDTPHSWKSDRTETHYGGNSNRRGTAFYAAIFPFPRGRSPERRPASLGERCPRRQRERTISRHKKQRAEIKNIALHVHRFLFVSSFYVRTWVFPRMGPRDNGGTHTILRSERLFPRRSTGLSGGTLPPRERESERQLSMPRCGCSPGWVPRTMGEHINNN